MTATRAPRLAVSWRAYLLVLAVALAVSANSLRNGFVYDDIPIIVEDSRMHDAPLSRLVTEPYWPASFGDAQLYRPVTSLSFALDWRGGGGTPFRFHLLNVMLHLAVVALVLTLAAALLPAGPAVVAALWFAVHPVHVEAVANSVGRAELVAALGYLLAVLACAAGGAPGITRGRRGSLAAAVLVCGLLAAGGKEHALTLPAALLVAAAAWAVVHKESVRERLARSGPLVGAGVAAAVLYLAARATATDVGFGVSQIAAGLEGKNALQRFVSMLPAYLQWGRLLAYPVRLSADYAPLALNPSLSLTAAHLGGLVVIAAALATAWWTRRRAPLIATGIAWFIVTASVAANVVVPTGVLVAERTLYLPSVGIAVAVGAAWSLLPPGRAVWPATALLLGLLGARSVERNTLWRDNTEFFARLAVDAPASYRSHWMRGTWEFRAGRFAAGERLYREALAIYPYDASLVAELGMWYLQARLFDPADRFLTLAVGMDSNLSEAAVKAVFARIEAGRVDSAASLARETLRRWPRRLDVLLIAVQAFELSGHTAEAAAAADALVARDGRWEHLQIAAGAHGQAGDCEGARSLARRAADLAPREEPAPRRLLERIGEGADCAARLR